MEAKCVECEQGYNRGYAAAMEDGWGGETGIEELIRQRDQARNMAAALEEEIFRCPKKDWYHRTAHQ